MILRMSDEVEEKLRRRSINQFHLLECFGNQTRSALVDEREEHKTDPPTLWFIAETENLSNAIYQKLSFPTLG